MLIIINLQANQLLPQHEIDHEMIQINISNINPQEVSTENDEINDDNNVVIELLLFSDFLLYDYTINFI